MCTSISVDWEDLAPPSLKTTISSTQKTAAHRAMVPTR